MAKISAYGDTQRWKFRSELVYTSRGRLLLKAIAGGGYTQLYPKATEDMVFAEVERRGMERV
jgi:hypothetical protein